MPEGQSGPIPTLSGGGHSGTGTYWKEIPETRFPCCHEWNWGGHARMVPLQEHACWYGGH